MKCNSDSCRQGRDECPTPHLCWGEATYLHLREPPPSTQPDHKPPPVWVPYLGGVIALVGAFAAYLYVVFGQMLWPVN